MQVLSDVDFAPPRMGVAGLLAGAAVIACIGLWPVLGHLAAYLSLILLLPAVVAGWNGALLRHLLLERWVQFFLVAFVLIALAFLLQPARNSLPNIGDFLYFALVPLIALAVAPLAVRRPAFKWLTWLFFGSALLCAVVGAQGFFSSQARATAPDVSPIHFADLAIMMGFMGLAGTLVAGLRWRLALLAGPLAGVAAAMTSGTRAALPVALILAGLYGLFWVWKRPWPLLAKLLVPVGLCVAVVLVFALAYTLGFTRPLEAFEPVLALLRGEMPSEPSAAYRVEMYVSGFRAFLDAPLFGHGWHAQLAAALPYMSPMAQEGYAGELWGYIHNDALSLAVAAGLPGLVAYVLVLVAPVLAALAAPGKADRSARLYLALTLSIGLLASGATDVLFMVELPKLLLVLVTALIFWAGVGADEEARP